MLPAERWQLGRSSAVTVRTGRKTAVYDKQSVSAHEERQKEPSEQQGHSFDG